jgi:molecular chaperone GrpE
VSALKSLNVESFGNVGDKFDPNLHNAIAHKEDGDAEQNVISNIFQKGYKMGDRIIRHAMVEVAN